MQESSNKVIQKGEIVSFDTDMVGPYGYCADISRRYPTDGGERSGTFEKNMTITIESYIGKVGGKEGVKLEQQYLVGQNNLELMSHHPLEDI